jgi:hypothetical protein
MGDQCIKGSQEHVTAAQRTIFYRSYPSMQITGR